MAHCIAVINAKGGVGKTTTTQILGRELAKKKRVLLVDIDYQMNLTSDLAGESASFQYGTCDIMRAQVNKTVDIKKCIQPYFENGQIFPNLDFIPSSPKLAEIEQEIQGHAKRERKLAKALKPIESQYDYIIVDCPPETKTLLHNAAELCDYFICPVTPDKKALRGIELTIHAIDPVKEDGFVLLILRSNIDARQTKSVNLMNEYLFDESPNGRFSYHENVMKTQIRTCSKFREVTGKSLIHTFAKGELVMNDIADLAKEVKAVIEATNEEN